jgi:hypothetical protein
MKRRAGHSALGPDTFGVIIRAYLGSPNFGRLAEATKRLYRTYLTQAEVILGDVPIGVIRPFLVQQCLDALATKPGAHQLAKAWERERAINPNLAPCAGLCLHGLRATAVISLRRAGATTPQIVDMVGLSARMVETYSRFADQKTSALAAVLTLDRTGIERECNAGNGRADTK